MGLLDQGRMLDGSGGLIVGRLEQFHLFAGEDVRGGRLAIDHAHCLIPHHHGD